MLSSESPIDFIRAPVTLPAQSPRRNRRASRSVISVPPDPFKDSFPRQDYESKLREIQHLFSEREIGELTLYQEPFLQYFPTDQERAHFIYGHYWTALLCRGLPLRDDGSTELSHSEKVTSRLVSSAKGIYYPSPVVVGAMAHDNEENCNVTFEDIEKELEERVRICVEGVSKLKGARFSGLPEDEQDALAMERVVQGMAIDPAIPLIKGADRIEVMFLDGMKDKYYKDGSLKKTAARRRLDKALETVLYVRFFRGMGIYHQTLARQVVEYTHPSYWHKIVDLESQGKWPQLAETEEGVRKFFSSVYQIDGLNSDFLNLEEKIKQELLKFGVRKLLENVQLDVVKTRKSDYLEIKDRLDRGEAGYRALRHVVTVHHKSDIESGLIPHLMSRYQPNNDTFYSKSVQDLSIDFNPYGPIVRNFEYQPGNYVDVEFRRGDDAMSSIYLPALIGRDPNPETLYRLDAITNNYKSYNSHRLGDIASERVRRLIENVVGNTQTVWVSTDNNRSYKELEFKGVTLPVHCSVLDVMCHILSDEDVLNVSQVRLAPTRQSKKTDVFKDLESSVAHSTYLQIERSDDPIPFYRPSVGFFEAHTTTPAKDFAARRAQELFHSDELFYEQLLPYIKNVGTQRLEQHLRGKYIFLEDHSIEKLMNLIQAHNGFNYNDFILSLGMATSEQVFELQSQLSQYLQNRIRVHQMIESNPDSYTDHYGKYLNLRGQVTQNNGELIGSYKEGLNAQINAIAFFPDEQDFSN